MTQHTSAGYANRICLVQIFDRSEHAQFRSVLHACFNGRTVSFVAVCYFQVDKYIENYVTVFQSANRAKEWEYMMKNFSRELFFEDLSDDLIDCRWGHL